MEKSPKSPKSPKSNESSKKPSEPVIQEMFSRREPSAEDEYFLREELRRLHPVEQPAERKSPAPSDFDKSELQEHLQPRNLQDVNSEKYNDLLQRIARKLNRWVNTSWRP